MMSPTRWKRLSQAHVDNRALLALKKKLEDYKLTHIQRDMRSACDLIIECIDKELVVRHAVNPHDETEVQILQRLIAYRMNGSSEGITLDKEFINSLVELGSTLF